MAEQNGAERGNEEHVSTRIDTALLVRLEALAASNDRSLAAEIRRAIRLHVEAAERKA